MKAAPRQRRAISSPASDRKAVVKTQRGVLLARGGAADVVDPRRMTNLEVDLATLGQLSS